VRSCAEKEECVYAQVGQCKAAARVLNIVKADTLGVDDEQRHGKGRHFGMKLEKVVDLIKKRIPRDERVLVFVQFPDLMKKVTEAFTEHKIPFLEIKGSAHAKSKNLEQFQNHSKERVLLLNVMDESASGANLTSANHAIFLSPLLAPSQEIYTACETQAIGRLVRYGQTKHVMVWKFLTTDTIDEEIYRQREQALARTVGESIRLICLTSRSCSYREFVCRILSKYPSCKHNHGSTLPDFVLSVACNLCIYVDRAGNDLLKIQVERAAYSRQSFWNRP